MINLKLLSAILSGALAACILSPLAVCAETSETENFHTKGKWGYTVLEDGTISISGYTGAAEELIIPSKIDGYTVSALGGGWYNDDGVPVTYGNIHYIEYSDDGLISESKVYSPFSGNEKIKSVTIPDTVTAIGAISFKDCTSLSEVNFGGGVTLIGNNCFEGCTSLETIEIPDTVEHIDQYAFKNCTSLKTAELSGSPKLEASLFEGCAALSEFEFPSGCTAVSPYMFADCTSLKNVTLSDTITQIGDSAFLNCTSLESIYLPDSAAAIYNNAFSGCTSLCEVRLSPFTETIGSRAFSGCSLTTLSVTETLTAIGESAFGTTPDGSPDESFILDCPPYSPAAAYATDNGITLTESAQAAETERLREKKTLPLPSSEMFNYVIIILIAAAVLIFIVIIVFIVKSKKRYTDYYDDDDDYDEDPEDEEYDSSDELADEDDIDYS